MTTEPSISAHGRYIAYSSRVGETGTIELLNRIDGTTTLVSRNRGGQQPNDYSLSPTISAYGGRWVAFLSYATDIVGREDRNTTSDIFLWDRRTGRTRLVSVSLAGTTGNGTARDASISGDGHFVVYESYSSDVIEDDGDDRNNGSQIYLYDRVARTTTVVSRAPDGSPARGYSFDPDISADGRFVTFDSNSTNLVPGANGGSIFSVFVADLSTGMVSLVSRNTDTYDPDIASFLPAVSADGRAIAFQSTDPELTPDADTGDSGNVFLTTR